MVGLKFVGYKEATIQKREMTFGELRHRIAKAYLKKPNRKIVILCLDNGERVETNSMEDILNVEWCDGCMIEVINMPHIWGVMNEMGEVEENDESAKCIITLQMAAIEDRDKTVL